MYTEHEQTFIENWPEELAKLSFKSAGLEVHERDVICIGAHTDAFMEEKKILVKPKFSFQLREDIKFSLSLFSGALFLRFGGVSYHDATLPRLKTVDDVFKQLSKPNHRVASYLWDCLKFSTPVWLFLREWEDIPRWGEFRCFIKGGKVIGVSQYHCLEYFPQLTENADAIRQQIIQFLREMVPLLHIEDVVADIAINYQNGQYSTKLIELNPFIQRTDACLFSWIDGGDFNGRIRVNLNQTDALAEKRKRPYLL